MARNASVLVKIIKDGDGRYYAGSLSGLTKRPICDEYDREEAFQMDDEEIARDFPDGLPAGWSIEEW